MTGPSGGGQCDTSQCVTLIGSRRDCHLPLNDPGVSKVHCAVVHTGHALVVCDLCSRSGTFLNGNSVRVAALTGGDRLRVGTIEIAVDPLGPSSEDDTAGTPACPTLPVTVTVSGHKLELAAGVALIGRRSTCDLFVDTPDVSLVHALLFAYDGRPAVCDLGSRSGTFLNGERIQIAWLYDGDQFTVGGEVLPITCEAVGSAAVPQRPATPLPVEANPGAPEAASSGAGHTPRALRAAMSELSATRRKVEERAAQIERREAELETLAKLLELQSEHVERLKAETARRASQVEQAANEARERLALALSHEQAVTAAWEELDRWHATREAKFKAYQEKLAQHRRSPINAASLEGFAATGALARPACVDVARSAALEGGVANA